MPTVDFVSNFRRHRLVRKTAEERILPNGAVGVVAPEVAYEFEERRLSVDEGRDQLADKWDPETQTWVKQDVVEYLRSHPDFDNTFFENTPTAPDTGPLYEQITKAIVAGDVDRLVALGQDEHQTWDRPEVMDLIRGALDKIDPQPVILADADLSDAEDD